MITPNILTPQPSTGGDVRPFSLRRLITLMEPNTDDPLEAGGVLNPAAARAPDGPRQERASE